MEQNVPKEADGIEKPLRRSSRNKIPDESSVTNNKPVSENGDDEYGFLDYRNVSRIRLGKYEFDAWYGNSALFKEPVVSKNDNKMRTGLAFKENNFEQSVTMPLTKKVSDTNLPTKTNTYAIDSEHQKPWIDILYVCPYCFKFTDEETEWEQHTNCCAFRTKLPGKVMYNDGELVVRKVKGIHHKLFCQCMCLMAKFFLDNKSMFYHLDYFDFYVAYQTLDKYEVPMGFYSRELLSWESNNLSCICVLPCYQKRHLGTKLIDFSYSLSKYEQQVSGPENPLSPLGKMTYLKYWCRTIALNFVYGELSTKKHVTLQMISESTFFRTEDILLSLSFLNVIYDNQMKDPQMDYYLDEYKHSDHFVFIEDGNYKVCIDKHGIKKWIVESKIPNNSILDKNCYIFY